MSSNLSQALYELPGITWPVAQLIAELIPDAAEEMILRWRRVYVIAEELNRLTARRD